MLVLETCVGAGLVLWLDVVFVQHDIDAWFVDGEMLQCTLTAHGHFHLVGVDTVHFGLDIERHQRHVEQSGVERFFQGFLRSHRIDGRVFLTVGGIGLGGTVDEQCRCKGASVHVVEPKVRSCTRNGEPVGVVAVMMANHIHALVVGLFFKDVGNDARHCRTVGAFFCGKLLHEDIAWPGLLYHLYAGSQGVVGVVLVLTFVQVGHGDVHFAVFGYTADALGIEVDGHRLLFLKGECFIHMSRIGVAGIILHGALQVEACDLTGGHVAHGGLHAERALAHDIDGLHLDVFQCQVVFGQVVAAHHGLDGQRALAAAVGPLLVAAQFHEAGILLSVGQYRDAHRTAFLVE